MLKYIDEGLISMYRKKALYALMVLIIIFGCAFLIALASLLRGVELLGIGLGYRFEAWITMIFSIMAIFRVLFEIIIVRH